MPIYFQKYYTVMLSSSLFSLGLLLESNSEIFQVSMDLIDSDQAAYTKNLGQKFQ